MKIVNTVIERWSVWTACPCSWRALATVWNFGKKLSTRNWCWLAAWALTWVLVVLKKDFENSWVLCVLSVAVLRRPSANCDCDLTSDDINSLKALKSRLCLAIIFPEFHQSIHSQAFIDKVNSIKMAYRSWLTSHRGISCDPERTVPDCLPCERCSARTLDGIPDWFVHSPFRPT